MRVDLCLLCSAALAIAGCADSHPAPEAFTVPDARPACVRIGGGGETVYYYLSQRAAAGDSCVVVSFYTQPAARPRGEPFSTGAITGPAEYFLSRVDRLSMPCNLARNLPYPGTTHATAGSGRVAVQYLGDHSLDDLYAAVAVTASLDLTFPAAPDGSRPPSTEHVRAFEIDARAPTSDECMNFGP